MTTPDCPRPRPLRRVMKSLFTFALIAGIFAFLIMRLARDWDSVRLLPIWGRPDLIALHLALMALLFAGLAIGWHVAVNTTGCRFTFRQSCFTWLTPNLGKYIPGKVFMFAGRIELGHRLGLRRATALTAMAVEHLMMFLASLPFVALALAHGLHLNRATAAVVLTLILVPAITVVAFPAGTKRIIDRMLGWIGRKPLAAFPGRVPLLMLLLLYLSVWLIYGLSGVVLVHAGDASGVSAATVIIAWVTAWAIGFASLLSPGGLGVREGAIVVLLAPWMPTSQAIALALLSRLTWMAVELLGVVLGLSLGRHESCPATVAVQNVESKRVS